MNTKHLVQLIIAVAVVLLAICGVIFTAKRRQDHPWAFRIVATLVTLFVLFVLAFKRPNPFFNSDRVPQIVTANVVDVADIYQVSKYRSGAGHDYSGNGEACRSMKHYINVSHNVDPVTHDVTRSQPTADHPNILIHAPFNGFILSIGGNHLGKQVDLIPWQDPWYTVRLDHMDVAPGFHALSLIKSGQVIGSIGPSDPLDISVLSGDFSLSGYGHLASYFHAMTDQVFAPWAALGYQRDDFIISKAYRDAHPMTCTTDPNSDAFVYPQNYDNRPDWVFLRPDPFGTVFVQNPLQDIHYGPPAR